MPPATADERPPTPGSPLPTPALPPPPSPAPSWLRPALIALTLLLATALIFARLGHNAFWEDEAATALGAKGILLTGSNYALIDHGNVVAYEDGNALHGLDNHVEPLLPPYATAASFALFGLGTFAGRLPFALFGLGTFALILFWARHAGWPVLAVLGLGLIGNVSLILYVRDCRYYAPTIFFSVALAYLYCHWRPTAGRVAAFVGLSILLFTSHYLDYLAFYVCLAFDYFVWQRKRSPLGWRVLLWILLPQLLINGAIAFHWNPLQTPHGHNLSQNRVWDKFLLYYWQWRDTNHCEFLCLPVLLAALGLGLARGRPWLVRGCVALALYLAVVTAVSPQLIHNGSVADVRYVTPIIPLAIGLETLTVCALFARRPGLQLALALVVFGTNLLHGGFLFQEHPGSSEDPRAHEGLRSTLVSYLGELAYPPPEPYTPTAAWINAHVPDGGSVYVLPNYTTYPLMYHAPRALYAWQFAWPPRPGYEGLPPIHFVGEVPPDYLVAFGPYLHAMISSIQYTNHLSGTAVSYQQVAALNVFWEELYRPEFFWRSFEPVADFDKTKEAVYIFKRANPPLPPDHEMKP